MKSDDGFWGKLLYTIFFCLLVTFDSHCAMAAEATVNQEQGPVATSADDVTDGKHSSKNEPSTEKSSTSGNALLYGGLGIAAVAGVLVAAGSGGGDSDESVASVPAASAPTTAKKEEDDEKEEKKESRPKITTPEDDNPPNSEPVGPDIRGGDWNGYLDLVHGRKENVNASISQNGNHVIITTSSNQEYGRKFVGTINDSGSIRVYDQRTGELWTTHEGPATKNRIDLYDYVDHYQALDRLYLER